MTFSIVVNYIKNINKKMKKQLINFLLLVLPFATITAQKVIEKGYVKMEITDASSEDPNMAMGLEMMKGSTTEIYFSKDKYVTVMDMMGGMVSIKNYVDTKSEKMDMLFDAMGNKMWIDSNLKDMKKNKPVKQDMSKMDVKYDKSETKDILGYKAYKTTITIPDTDGMKVIGWITEDIKTEAMIIQGMEDLKLNGFPLEFSIVSPQMKITFAAKEIKDTVDEGIFALKTEGYKKMTMEEFSKQMGGMGGMGF